MDRHSRRPAKDGATLAESLTAANKLTSFQARELLAGRGDLLVTGDDAIPAEIGAGGLGRVYKARHRTMERVVALQVMSGPAMKDGAAVKRFQREVRAAARLEHSNIVTAYDSGSAGSVSWDDDAGRCYAGVPMERVRVGLAPRVRDHRNLPRNLSVPPSLPGLRG